MGCDDCAADCALLQGPARGEHAEYAELVRKIYCNEIDLKVFGYGQKIIKSHDCNYRLFFTSFLSISEILHNLQMFISKLENKTNHFKEKYLIPHDGYFFNYVLIYVVTF